MKIRFIQNIILLVIIFSFSYSREYNCLEMDSIITGRYNNGDYEIAHNMAQKGSSRDTCSAFFYVHLADVFKKFDDFSIFDSNKI